MLRADRRKAFGWGIPSRLAVKSLKQPKHRFYEEPTCTSIVLKPSTKTTKVTKAKPRYETPKTCPNQLITKGFISCRHQTVLGDDLSGGPSRYTATGLKKRSSRVSRVVAVFLVFAGVDGLPFCRMGGNDVRRTKADLPMWSPWGTHLKLPCIQHSTTHVESCLFPPPISIRRAFAIQLGVYSSDSTARIFDIERSFFSPTPEGASRGSAASASQLHVLFFERIGLCYRTCGHTSRFGSSPC